MKIKLKKAQNIRNIENIRFIIFCILWTVYYCTIFLDITAWFVLFQTESMFAIIKIIRYAVYLCLIGLIITRRRIRKKIVICVVACAAVFAVQSVTINSNIMVALLLFAFEASEFDQNRVIKCTMVVEAVLLFLTILSSSLIPGLTVVVYEYDRGIDRNLMGFAWAFHAPNLLLFVYLQYVYLKKKNIKFIHMLVFEIISVLFYIISKTRTPLILTTGVTLVVLFLNHSNGVGKLLKKHSLLLKSIPFIFVLISLSITMLYTNTDGWRTLNTIFHDRLRLQSNALSNYGITIWGQEINWIGSQYLSGTWYEYNFVDNAYMQMLIKNGVMVTVLTLIIYSIMMKNALSVYDVYLEIILVFLFVYGMVNPCLLDLTMNSFILLFFSKFRPNNLCVSSKYNTKTVAQYKSASN